MPKKNFIGALFRGNCPRCREGNMFKYPALKLSRFTQMHSHCSVCSYKFEPEPGFYIGAMFVTYAFTVAVIVTVTVALNVLSSPSMYDYIIWSTLFNLLLIPFNFRFSRVAFLHFFGGAKYQQYK
jgi:uncharacterized protein (DUF983 family)